MDEKRELQLKRWRRRFSIFYKIAEGPDAAVMDVLCFMHSAVTLGVSIAAGERNSKAQREHDRKTDRVEKDYMTLVAAIRRSRTYKKLKPVDCALVDHFLQISFPEED